MNLIAFSEWICYNNPMSKNNSKKMDIFRYKFTPVLILCCILGLLLAIVGIIENVYRMIANGGIFNLTDVLKYPFLIAVCGFLIILIIALLVKSQYVVTDEYFITQFGFIKTKFLLKEITSIVHDRDTHKLSVYLGEIFYVISCSAEWEDDFVHSILQSNGDISYSYTLTENKPPENEQEK